MIIIMYQQPMKIACVGVIGARTTMRVLEDFLGLVHVLIHPIQSASG
jgi:hypothetical protein